MDKYEFKISLNEINNLIAERRFEEAAQIADGIDWNHVKSTDTLCRVSEVYKVIGDYDKSRDVMAIARERDQDNPAILYALCELTIFLYGRDGLQSDLTLALQLMQEFKTTEPNNPKRLILQYKMYGVSPVSDQEKIAVLEQLKSEKFMPRWVYELARLYAAEGDAAKGAAACREVLRNAPDSTYAGKAQELLGRLNLTAAGTAKDSKRAEMETAEPAAAEDQKAQDEVPAALAEETEQTQEPSDAAEELTQESQEEPVPSENSDAADEQPSAEEDQNAAPEPEEETQEELPIRSPEEQHHVDSLQNSIAREMQDIYARPYDDKLEQETNGQYSMVMDTPQEPEQQVEGQISISEVMAEWEKIRADIRKANDEKRAQRILEDTGALIQDFDETARHGLLEDIEKGVARQRRQVRSGAYRMGDELPQRPVRREPPRSSRPAYCDEERAAAERTIRNTGDLAAEESVGARQAAENRPIRRRQENMAEPVRRPRRQPVPVSNEDDDVKVYGGNDDVEELATRRWNSEEIHRAMARQEELVREEEAANARERQRLQEDYPAEEDTEDQQEFRENPQYVDEYIDAEEDGELQEAAPLNEDTEESVAGNSAEKVSEYEESAEEEYEEAAEEVTEPAETTDLQEEAPAPEYEEKQPEDEPAAEETAEAEYYEKEPEEEELSEEKESEEESEPSDEEEEPEEELAEEEPEEEEPVRRVPERRRERSTERTPQKRARTGEQGVRPREQHRQRPAAPQQNAAPQQDAGQQEAPRANASVQHKGGKRQLTREERRLFGPFCRMRENVDQLTEALDQISLASSTGNVLIIGNDATADRVAKGILEVTRRTDSNFTGKIAKVTGDALNRLSAEGFAKTFEKLSNGALIVSKATELAPKAMERLYHELEGKDHGLILILTDGNKKMEQFRHENEQYLGSFTAVISIRPLNDKALVAYAKDYAMSQDYSIDEFGQLALAQRIAAMQTSTHQVTLKEVRDLVDEAISYASKKTPHTLLDVMAKRRYDENDRIIIHEKDFMHS